MEVSTKNLYLVYVLCLHAAVSGGTRVYLPRRCISTLNLGPRNICHLGFQH